MPSRTVLEQWEALRLRLNGFRSWLGTPERARTLLLLLWPLVALVVVGLVIRLVSTAKELADLISALASLAWPLVALAVVSWFRPELRVILSRIRKGKFLGTEFELDELQAKTVAAEEKAELTVISGEASAYLGEANAEASGTTGADVAQDAIEQVLREASRSPPLGLVLLWTKIEQAARDLAVDAGLRATRPLTTIVRQLVAEGRLPEEAAEAVYLFSRVHSRLVHEGRADDDEITRAIDSGTRLLRLLMSRPRLPGDAAKVPDTSPKGSGG
jgi:hypothetical protein